MATNDHAIEMIEMKDLGSIEGRIFALKQDQRYHKVTLKRAKRWKVSAIKVKREQSKGGRYICSYSREKDLTGIFCLSSHSGLFNKIKEDSKIDRQR